MSIRTYTTRPLVALRQYPFDLAVVSVAAIVAYAIVATASSGSALRLAVTLPLALFLPGYALTALLFPGTETRAATRAARPVQWSGIDVVERLAISFALSLTVVPIVVLVLPITGWGLGAEPIAATLGGITVVAAQLGVVRRLRLSRADRFTVSPVSALERRRESGPTVTLSTIVLGGAIVFAIGALLFGLLAPTSAGGYSELGLYTEDDDTGDLVTGDLPAEIAPGETASVTVGLENQEGAHTEYTVVVQQQILDDGEVTDRTELDRLEASVPDGETVTTETAVAPTPNVELEEPVRVGFLLFEGEPPNDPTADDAVVDTYFWTTVTEDALEDE
ncbi:DUF1616 domain-containing protein [Natrarchaeobaculum aegyptiacum]|uniref:DUF1616 domain-containing protein n=1 Tax=Natrarchaeobaculum aegyptiacum TaxID=745377 RepID=A0A2Z2I1A8_9EURY|nr:DUF1616 domain-containing protein [Natrarchaeobaculum aegyptiacum]ARS90188.1 hypothetical protein B1756_10945 [Natrarchaeobaculum aegyptiacum]